MQNKESEDKARRATEILDAYFTGKLPIELAEKIQGWLVTDHDRETKELELEKIYDHWVKFDAKPGSYAHSTLKVIHYLLGFPENAALKIMRRKKIAARAAAVLIPTLFAVAAFYTLTERATDRDVQLARITESVPEGGMKQIKLPDGSEIRVGEATTIAYAEDFTVDRAVYLDGEAFFIVAPLDGKPFLVRTGDLTVTVLGTEFNVMAYAGRAKTEVALSSGKVEIETEGRRISLNPMTKFVLDKPTGAIEVTAVEYREMRVMKNRALTFEDIPVADVLQRIAQYYEVTLDISDGPPLSLRPVRIAFDAEDSLDDVLFALKTATESFHYEIKADSVAITAR